MKTRPSQQKKNKYFSAEQFFTNVLNNNAFRMLFSYVSQVLLLLCHITWSSFSTCKSCHCTAVSIVPQMKIIIFPQFRSKIFIFPLFRSKNLIFPLFRSKKIIFPQFRSKIFIFPQFRSKSQYS
jgi:hypothetical protein